MGPGIQETYTMEGDTTGKCKATKAFSGKDLIVKENKEINFGKIRELSVT